MTGRPIERTMPSPTLTGLPVELVLMVLSHLSLCDLGSLTLTNRALRQSAAYTAARHKQRKVLQRTLGWRWNVLDIGAWSAQPFGDIPRPVECFGRVEEPVEAADLVDLADLFSRLARSLYVSHGGFSALHSGALPGHYLDITSEDTPAASLPRVKDGARSGALTAQRAHSLHLFLLALLYSAIRALSRRSQSSSSREREADEWSSLQLQRCDIESLMQEQYRQLKRAIMRCDPLDAHVRALLTAQQGTRKGKGKGKASEASTSVAAPSTCLCHSRTHAAWYSIVWHHLVVRFRRFVTPQDQEHIAYRKILFAQPSFPSAADGFGDDCFISQGSQPSGPFSWLWNKKNGGTADSSAPSVPRVGLPLFNTPPPLPHTTIPPNLPLSTLHSLNPDSLLFTLTESPTFAQTKAAFGLSEFALAPGLSRLWAGWIGYSWGEGGAEWSNEEMKAAERRIAGKASNEGDAAAQPSTEPAGSHQRGLAFGIPKLTGRLSSETDMVMQPVEVILLGHARWRARQLLAIERRAEKMAARRNEHGESPEPEDEEAFTAMNHQNTAFDVHFVRRALQIQQWALQSYDASDSAGGQAPQAGTAYGQTIPAGGLPLAPGAARILPGQVHPSSPFLVLQRNPHSKATKAGSQSSAPTEHIDPHEEGLRAVPEYAWQLVGASLISFLNIPELTAPRAASQDPQLYRTAVLTALGDLHAGLFPSDDVNTDSSQFAPRELLPCAEDPVALHAVSDLRLQHIAAAQARPPRSDTSSLHSSTPSTGATNLSRLGLGRRTARREPSRIGASQILLGVAMPAVVLLLAWLLFYADGRVWTQVSRGALVNTDW